MRSVARTYPPWKAQSYSTIPFVAGSLSISDHSKTKKWRWQNTLSCTTKRDLTKIWANFRNHYIYIFQSPVVRHRVRPVVADWFRRKARSISSRLGTHWPIATNSDCSGSMNERERLLCLDHITVSSLQFASRHFCQLSDQSSFAFLRVHHYY